MVHVPIGQFKAGIMQRTGFLDNSFKYKSRDTENTITQKHHIMFSYDCKRPEYRVRQEEWQEPFAFPVCNDVDIADYRQCLRNFIILLFNSARDRRVCS